MRKIRCPKPKTGIDSKAERERKFAHEKITEFTEEIDSLNRIIYDEDTHERRDILVSFYRDLGVCRLNDTELAQLLDNPSVSNCLLCDEKIIRGEYDGTVYRIRRVDNQLREMYMVSAHESECYYTWAVEVIHRESIDRYITYAEVDRGINAEIDRYVSACIVYVGNAYDMSRNAGYKSKGVNRRLSHYYCLRNPYNDYIHNELLDNRAEDIIYAHNVYRDKEVRREFIYDEYIRRARYAYEVFVAINYFMQRYPTTIPTKKNTIIRNVIDQKNRNNKKVAKTKIERSVVYISEHTISSINEAVQQSKKSRIGHERQFEYTTRGHWRHYKSGKVIWVHEHLNCVGKPRKPKDYAVKK